MASKARKSSKAATKPAANAAAKPKRAATAPVTRARPMRPTRPSLPPPPAPPPPPQPRDELPAPRDVARLTRYGERFGPHKIDVRLLPLQLPVGSGALALFDPAAPKSWRVLDRPAGSGAFRVMLSIARDERGAERLAAIVIHVGRPPIARWTVAHYRGQKKPKSADQLPRCTVSGGWLALIDAGEGSPGVLAVPEGVVGVQPIEVPLTDGRRALALPCGNGEFAAYWAVDLQDKPICLVVDFDVFTQKEWKARPV
ncbi:MAG TPA: hypothetical protein VMJ10_05710 [Kofleriaceae bacterium]|nr:hypothetical protein [Kofleriaceae bacterium]